MRSRSQVRLSYLRFSVFKDYCTLPIAIAKRKTSFINHTFTSLSKIIMKTMLLMSRRTLSSMSISSSLRRLSTTATVQVIPPPVLRGGGGRCSSSSSFGTPMMLLRSPHYQFLQRQQQQMRFYRGGAGDSPPVLSSHEEALLQIAKPKAAVIMAEHHKLPNLADIPKDSLNNNNNANEDDDDSSALDSIRRKRLIYRSKQRGWLEVDLLLGTFASENVMQLNEQELNEFEDFVNMETIDIYNIITLKTTQPEESNNKMVQRIQEWARGNPLGKADPDMYRTVKASAKLI